MSKIINVTTQKELDKVVSENKKVLVNFWAPWCSRSSMIASTIDIIAEEDNGITTVKINTDDATELVFKLGVRSVPTIVTYVDGKRAKILVGASSKKHIWVCLDTDWIKEKYNIQH
jgi:thioredoxin 1